MTKNIHTSLNGINFAENGINIESLLEKGFGSYVFLDGNINEAKQISQRNPDIMMILRIYQNKIEDYSPEQLVNRISTFPFVHVIPYNEANLGLEHGSPGMEQNLDYRKNIYVYMEDYWEKLVTNFRRVCLDKKLHFPAWSPWDGSIGPFWPGADVYDLHLYGNVDSMITMLDISLSMIPEEKPVFISEWNWSIPWDNVNTSEITRFLCELHKRERVIGASAFTWFWTNQDLNFPNLNLKDTVSSSILGDWRPYVAIEYGFPGFDGFDELVSRIGELKVGKPLHIARYNAVKNTDGTYKLGADSCYQYTENGMLIGVKLDDDSWLCQFYKKDG